MYVGLPKYLVNWESESESWHLLPSWEFSPSRGLSFSPHFANMCHRSWGGLNLKERLRLVFYYLCWYIPLSLGVHPSEGLKKLPWNTLLLAVAMHDLQEVGKADLAPLVTHVGLELRDGGGHPQTPHDHSQLIHGGDLTWPDIAVDILLELGPLPTWRTDRNIRGIRQYRSLWSISPGRVLILNESWMGWF